MNSNQLYERIKDKNAYVVYTQIKLQLRTLPPNGATIHRLKNLSHIINGYLWLYETGKYKQEEKFENHLKGIKSSKSSLETILEILEKFHVII